MEKYSRLWLKIKNLFIPSGIHGDLKRGFCYKNFIKKCGKNFKVSEGAFIYSPELLEVGDNVYIGFCSYIGNGPIVLGDEVLIGNHVSITAANHLPSNGSFRFGGSELAQIKIGTGSWIAAHSCITAGVEIGDGCLVAAGSVVTKSFPDFVLIAGAPAKIIRKL